MRRNKGWFPGQDRQIAVSALRSLRIAPSSILAANNDDLLAAVMADRVGLKKAAEIAVVTNRLSPMLRACAASAAEALPFGAGAGIVVSIRASKSFWFRNALSSTFLAMTKQSAE